MARIMNVGELAEYLGIGKTTVRKLVKSKEIPHTRVGRQVKFMQEDIDAWFKAKNEGSKNEQG